MIGPAVLLGALLAGLLGFLTVILLRDGGSASPLAGVDPASGHPLRIEIRAPSPGTQFSAGDPVIVFVQAFERYPIARYELWVDGELARTMTPDHPAASAVARMTWLPGEPGAHVLVARGFTPDGSMDRSDPVVVEALADPHDGLTAVRVEVGEGATVTSIAQELGASLEDVMVAGGGDPQPGDELVVYLPADRVPEGYVDDDGPAPGASPEPPPEPQGEDGAEARPADDAAPDELPWGFDRIGDPDPPEAPADLRVTRGDGCDVRLDWRDTSESETGFRLYRFSGGGDFRAIRDLEAGDGTGALAYTDRVLTGGHYEYYVASMNAGGATDSNLAGVDVPADACTITAPGISVTAATTLQFEATSMATNTQFDDAYCYLSLARLEPYARIPAHERVFLSPTRDGWNIDVHASGMNRRIFTQDPDAPVAVRLECWGRRGDDEPVLLGSFEADHPREEWDGRDLFGNADEFRVTYHIEPYENLLRAWAAIEDPGIPVPANVRQPDDKDECDEYADFSDGEETDGLLALWYCAEVVGDEPRLSGRIDPALIWDWAPNDAYTRETIDGFRVYLRSEGDAFGDSQAISLTWDDIGDAGAYTQLFPIPLPPCNEPYAYQVTAFVAPAGGGEERESPRSPTFRLERPGCDPPQVQVEITLISVDVRDVDDGVRFRCALFVLCVPVYDFVLDAYGSGGFNVLHSDGLAQVDYGTNFLFFTHDCGGQGEAFLIACTGFNPLEIGVSPGDEGTVRFEDQQMVVCRGYASCTDWGTGHNTFTVNVQDGDSIQFWFNLRDDDTGSPDDTWCGTDEDYSFESEVDESVPFIIGPYSLDEWLNIWPEDWNNAANALDDQDANCTMHLQVHGTRIRP